MAVLELDAENSHRQYYLVTYNIDICTVPEEEGQNRFAESIVNLGRGVMGKSQPTRARQETREGEV